MELDRDAYRLLFDANPRPMFVADRETLQILLVNRAACEHYGWSRDEFQAMTLRDIRPVEEVAVFDRSFVDSTKDRAATYVRAGRHRTKDGRTIDVTLEITKVTLGGRPASLAVVTDITGIAHAERRFRLLVEHSADGIALTNEQHVVEYVSPGGQRILGYPSAEVVGKPAVDHVYPQDVPLWSSPAPGDTRHHVSRVRHRDGSWRWIESSTTNLTHDPAVRAFVSNYRDVTARKIAEDALVESQHRLEFLLSATSAITYTARVAGEVGATFIGANVQEVLGHEPAAFYTEPSFWRNNIHPDDLAAVDDALRTLAASGSHALEYRFRHRDGSYRWMRDVGRIVGEGATLEIVGCWIDVTEHVQAGAALRRSETSFRTLIERAPMATFVHREGRYLYANPAAVAMLGYRDAAQVVGRAVTEFIHPDDRELVQARMAQTIETGSVGAGVARMIRADGSVFVIETEGMRLDFDGQPSNVVMGHDVTERHEVFARMALADRMVTVGTLAAGVAHEINNPLAYVAANLELIAMERSRARLTGTELEAIVADARDGVDRVTTIVRDLRALSRPDDEVRGPVDVGAVLATSIKMAHNEIRHRARVVVDCASDVPQVQAEPTKLGQVFLNLLLNAAQAITDGNAERNEIRVCARATGDGRHVQVEIADTGIGMSEVIQRRIFDPFFTTKAPGAGTGLGLSISHQIVRSFDGEITVDSKPGQGSRFRVTLPVAAGVQACQAPPPEARPTTLTRILLIDDEVALGRSLRLLLAPETEVIAVTRAADALARLATGERFDAIVCDLMMPELSGIELYDRLLYVAPDCAGRIIFMTGGAFTPQARAFLASLDRPHLEKPFTEAQLRRAIEGVAREAPTRTRLSR